MLKIKINNWKQLLIVVVLTIAIMILCAPIYISPQLLQNFNNDKSRIVIYNDGFQNNTLKLKSQHPNANFGPCIKNGTSCFGYILTNDISHHWKNFNFQLEIVGDGTLYVDLRGPEGKKYNNHTIDPIIDYRNFAINGKQIFSDKHSFSYNNTYQKYFNVRNGDIININIDIKNHSLDFGDIDELIFLSILMLSFLFSYKLTQFAANYKLKEQKSRIDIVFLTIFICLLFIPMSRISNDNISTQENRTLAKYPPLITENGINNRFGEQFNSWFNDRFLGRKYLLSLYGNITHFIAPHHSNDNAFIGENGFLWSRRYDSVAIYCNNKLFTPEELKISGENIKNFVNAAKRHGIKEVYFMLSNDKESMYSEYYPKGIKKISQVSRLEQFLNYVHSTYPEIKFYNFKDNFEKIKEKETIFYKTGTHLNNIGAFFEYYFLTNEIKKDFPYIKILTLNDFNITISDDPKQPGLDLDTYNMFTRLPKYEKSNFTNKILSLKSPSNITIQNIEINGINKDYGNFVIGINHNIPYNLTAFAIGDSFLLRYHNYLLETFSRVDRVFWGYGLDFTLTPEMTNHLKHNIPDILIIETAERFLQRFLNLKFPNFE